MLVQACRVCVGIALALALVGATANADTSFTETYEAGTLDVGHWILTTNSAEPRIIETTGGHPGGYLYGEVGSAVPTWSTASTRYQPGVNDDAKRDSVFVGDYYANNINHVGADLEVEQAGSWTQDRTVTLQLVSWDAATDAVAFEATYSLPDMPRAPNGWKHYDFAVDARSPTIPKGWVFTRGDGTPGTDAEWATFMHQIDLVGFGYWKPGYGYPSLGVWKLGIDNIHIGTQ
ncbi:MAG: hypothetical protein E6J90_49975 [Deltaproteobacteria bacterium]|nr:MAG: hypothetical protein E6J90_49975 [Deltaproteobacteria bacterium]TMQ08986.1 MAG: hypothetical protein E6J91_31905 [Deltaproteobacteria bacterium]